MHPIPEKIVGIQLDLKYHMPNKQYLMSLIEELPDCGINTVLIEYEDKFPFRKYPFLRAKDAFTPEELEDFLTRLHSLELLVIPLVQSLSHFEFALNHSELASMRERADIPTMICPQNPEAVQLVMDLMEEVLEYHQDDPLFHCGGDEVWALGKCDTCRPVLDNLGKEGMWLQHQKRIAELIRTHGKQAIFWDDIFWEHPERAAELDLPKDIILHSWNYQVQTTACTSIDSGHSEFGGSQKLRQVDVYRQHNIDCLGSPCCNYGQLFPRHRESIGNTQAWAEKVCNANMLGLINTSWAVFHVPLQMQRLYFHLTGILSNDPGAKITPQSITDWFEAEYAPRIDNIPEALEKVSCLWELEMENFNRPFTPIIYSYMNMVLHYPGGQRERKNRGSYPGDWDEIDLNQIYLDGVNEIQRCNLSKVLKELDQKLDDYAYAAEVFSLLNKQATKRENEAFMFALFAEMKLASAKALSFLLRQDIDRGDLMTELEEQRLALQEVLVECYEPDGQTKMLAAWLEPAYEAIKNWPDHKNVTEQ